MEPEAGMSDAGRSGLTSQVNEHIFKIRKTLLRSRIKVVKLKNKRNFLLTCKNNNIFPRSVQFNKSIIVSNNICKQRLERIRNIFHSKLMGVIIDDIHRNLVRVEKSIVSIVTKLRRITNDRCYESILRFIDNVCNKLYLKCKEKGKKKFNWLISSQHSKLNVRESWITNLTNKNIPNDIKYILQMGP
ncbi:MAG TPA: hypothetical protein VIQ04_06260, partial [Nitrososphaeraceae archaeon]